MVTKLGRDTFADIALNTMKELGMKQDRILYSDDTEDRLCADHGR